MGGLSGTETSEYTKKKPNPLYIRTHTLSVKDDQKNTQRSSIASCELVGSSSTEGQREPSLAWLPPSISRETNSLDPRKPNTPMTQKFRRISDGIEPQRGRFAWNNTMRDGTYRRRPDHENTTAIAIDRTDMTTKAYSCSSIWLVNCVIETRYVTWEVDGVMQENIHSCQTGRQPTSRLQCPWYIWISTQKQNKSHNP